MNLLSQRDVSIISPLPGTTRDVVETTLDIGGYPVVLADTAGLRAARDADIVEREGMRRTRQRADIADLRLFVVDVTDLPPADDPSWSQIFSPPQRDDEEATTRQPDASPLLIHPSHDIRSADDVTTAAATTASTAHTIIVLNKSDLIRGSSDQQQQQQQQQQQALKTALSHLQHVLHTHGAEPHLVSGTSTTPRAHSPSPSATRTRVDALLMSCHSRDGCEELLSLLQRHLERLFSVSDAAPSAVITRQRHRDHLRKCLHALHGYLRHVQPATLMPERRSDAHTARSGADDLVSLDMLAEELRFAATSLGRLTGRIDAEEVLDEIFSAFCIGK